MPVCMRCKQKTPDKHGIEDWAKPYLKVGWDWDPQNRAISKHTRDARVEVDESGLIIYFPYCDDNGSEISLSSLESAVHIAEMIVIDQGEWTEEELDTVQNNVQTDASQVQ